MQHEFTKRLKSRAVAQKNSYGADGMSAAGEKGGNSNETARQ
jgi:hypothetical protein